jgi:hypothetical protein
MLVRREETLKQWEEDVQQDVKVMKIYHWKKQAKRRNEWQQITEQDKTHIKCQHRQKKKRKPDGTLTNHWA